MLGSVIAQTSEALGIQATYFYSPYGEGSAQGEGLDNTTQFAGRENDGTGLYFYRARYYDPALKRFIASDPIGLDGGLNTYSYVDGDPLFQIDPLGLFGWRDVASYVPVVGSALDAFDAFKCGNIGAGLLHTALAVTDLTGGGALAKGILVGGFKLSQRTALKQVYKEGRSMKWRNVRSRMRTRNLVTKDVPTHHVIPQEWSWVPDRIMNHPMNLMPDIGDIPHKKVHSSMLNRLWDGTPKWAQGSLAAAGSYAAGLYNDSGSSDCGCQ